MQHYNSAGIGSLPDQSQWVCYVPGHWIPHLQRELRILQFAVLPDIGKQKGYHCRNSYTIEQEGARLTAGSRVVAVVVIAFADEAMIDCDDYSVDRGDRMVRFLQPKPMVGHLDLTNPVGQVDGGSEAGAGNRDTRKVVVDRDSIRVVDKDSILVVEVVEILLVPSMAAEDTRHPQEKLREEVDSRERRGIHGHRDYEVVPCEGGVLLVPGYSH